MKYLRWVLVAVVSAVFLYTCALPGDLPASVDTTDGLPGTYSVNGVDPSGSEISGTAVIRAADSNSDYDLELLITGSILQGRGVFSGDRFQGTWQAISSAAGPVTGSFEYERAVDGTLTGVWSVDRAASPAGDGTGAVAGGGSPEAQGPDQSEFGTMSLYPDP